MTDLVSARQSRVIATLRDPSGIQPKSCSDTRCGAYPRHTTPSRKNACPCTVLDPFNGAGTTGLVALRLARNYAGIELNVEYLAMSERRVRTDAPLFWQQVRS